MVLHKTDYHWQLFWYFNTIEYSCFYHSEIFITSTPKLDIKIMKIQFFFKIYLNQMLLWHILWFVEKTEHSKFLSLKWEPAPMAELLMRLIFTQRRQVWISALPNFFSLSSLLIICQNQSYFDYVCHQDRQLWLT